MPGVEALQAGTGLPGFHFVQNMRHVARDVDTLPKMTV